MVAPGVASGCQDTVNSWPSVLPSTSGWRTGPLALYDDLDPSDATRRLQGPLGSAARRPARLPPRAACLTEARPGEGFGLGMGIPERQARGPPMRRAATAPTVPYRW